MGEAKNGWALGEQGEFEKGIAQMHQGLATMRELGLGIGLPWGLALLAETYWKSGQAEQGLSVIDEALTIVHNGGQRTYEAELCRLKGELLLIQGDGKATASRVSTDEAEACFRQAIEIASRQQAKSLELRATVSLCRLLQERGEEGRQMLAEIYGWFTEGFDTPNLKDAKALLKELS